MWPFAHGGPAASGSLRLDPEDFRVDEELGFEPDGQGEHWLIHVEKRGANTHWVAGQLARLAGLPPKAVSYSGLKDRQAVTRQWFSVHDPGRCAPSWSGASGEGFRVLRAERHGRKLRRGSHRGNRFRIRVRELKETADLAARLDSVSRSGVPNYFGEQRFGRAGSNPGKAAALFAGASRARRHERSLYLSAARSWLFNRVLAVRVIRGNWDHAMDGEVFALDGTRSVFSERLDETLQDRIASQDVHPSGPLWGRGGVVAGGACLDLETGVLRSWPLLCRGLEEAGLQQERRATRLPVRELEWDRARDALVLEFTLGRGEFATSVLRELVSGA